MTPAPFDIMSPWYDAIYAARGKDVAGEARAVLDDVTRARGGTPPTSWLDVACGTGAHLAALQPLVPRLAGLDAHPGMLAEAARRLPGVPLERGDMTVMPRPDATRHDVVSCLFASIGYLADVDALRAAIRSMAARLAAGGVLAVEPPLTPDRVTPPRAQRDRCTVHGRTIERRTNAILDGDVLRIRFELQADDDRGTPHTEEHAVRLYDDRTVAEAFTRAGMRAEVLERANAPRRLWIAVST